MSLVIPLAKIQSFTHFPEKEFRKIVKIERGDQRTDVCVAERME